MGHTQAALPQGVPALVWVTLRWARYPATSVSFQGCITSHLPTNVPYHISSISFFKMHRFTFLLMSPLFASSHLSFYVSSVHPHVSPSVSPAPAATAFFSICLSRGAMFLGQWAVSIRCRASWTSPGHPAAAAPQTLLLVPNTTT